MTKSVFETESKPGNFLTFTTVDTVDGRELKVERFIEDDDDFYPNPTELSFDEGEIIELLKFIMYNVNVCTECFEMIPQGKRCNCMRDE